MSLATHIDSALKRLPCFGFGQRHRDPPRTPSILAIGDSWFFYPLPGGSLIDGLHAAVAGKHVIRAIGSNGAALREFVVGRHREEVIDGLERDGAHLDAVIVSVGGNDFADRSALLPMLHDDCAGARRAVECFRPGTAAGSLAEVMARVIGHYDLLIDRILATADAGARIVLHDYDNALPSGKPFLIGTSAWFKPVFDAVRVPGALQRSCLVHILDLFTASLERIVAHRGGRVVLVHSRGTLSACEWADELHPTAAGFRKLAAQAWLPVLRAVGIA